MFPSRKQAWQCIASLLEIHLKILFTVHFPASLVRFPECHRFDRKNQSYKSSLELHELWNTWTQYWVIGQSNNLAEWWIQHGAYYISMTKKQHVRFWGFSLITVSLPISSSWIWSGFDFCMPWHAMTMCHLQPTKGPFDVLKNSWGRATCAGAKASQHFWCGSNPATAGMPQNQPVKWVFGGCILVRTFPDSQQN